MYTYINGKFYYKDTVDQNQAILDLAVFAGKIEKEVDDYAFELNQKRFLIEYTCNRACEAFYKFVAKHEGYFGY